MFCSCWCNSKALSLKDFLFVWVYIDIKYLLPNFAVLLLLKYHQLLVKSKIVPSYPVSPLLKCSFNVISFSLFLFISSFLSCFLSAYSFLLASLWSNVPCLSTQLVLELYLSITYAFFTGLLFGS